MGTLEDLDVAIAHWHVTAWGGAEYLVSQLADVLGVDEVYTIGTPEPDGPNPYGDQQWIDVTGGVTDWVRKRAGRAGEYALWEDVDWSEFGDPDVLVTSGSTTRAVITSDDVFHVNYCHSTPRWLYDLYHLRKRALAGRLARPALRYLRIRDHAVDARVDQYLANSPVIARRLWKYYKRDATVLYPPVDLTKYSSQSDGDFFLHLGRLDSEKGIEEVVAAFDGRTERLVLAGGRGDAPAATMRTIDGSPNMEYLGFVDNERKYELLATCRAVVFNGVNEDFGIVPIEANASQKPCLARSEGFPGLFVEDGYNGLLHDGTSDGIATAIDRLPELDDSVTYDSLLEPFSRQLFESRLRRLLETSHESFQQTFDPPDPDTYA